MGSDKINSTVKNPLLSWEELTPKTKPEIEALLKQCFPVEPNQSFFDDFPIWDPAISVDGRKQILGRDSNGVLVCSASCRVATLVLDQTTHIRLGIVGAVASHPEYRGKGHASSAIEKILKSAVLLDSKIECIVLWGSEKNLYSRFGFDYGGTQKRSALDNLVLPEFLPDPSLDVQMGWHDEIFHLMQKRQSGLSHILADLNWLKSHPNVVWFRIIREGHTTAFVGVNRGIDLMGIVHEWGGSELDLGILLSAMKVESPNLQIIFHPEHEKTYSFFKRTEHFETDRLCMLKWMGSPNPKTLERLWFFGLDSG